MSLSEDPDRFYLPHNCSLPPAEAPVLILGELIADEPPAGP